MRTVGDYIYAMRYVMILPLMIIAAEYFSSEPTRLIVSSGIFIFSIYTISLFSWLFLKRLFLVRNSLVILWLFIPLMFVNLANSRFNGGTDLSFDTLYQVFLWLFLGQVVLWFLSLRPMNRLFWSISYKQRNRAIKQQTLDCISEQIALEKRQPDESSKASLSGLYELEDLVESFPIEMGSDLFSTQLLKAMSDFQNNYESVFTDEYNSAKATMGSAIKSAERFLW